MKSLVNSEACQSFQKVCTHGGLQTLKHRHPFRRWACWEGSQNSVMLKSNKKVRNS